MFRIGSQRDRIRRAALRAAGAANAGIRHRIGDQGLALARRADPCNVRLDLFPEITQRGQHGVRCRPAQAAETATLHRARQMFQGDKVGGLSRASAKPFEQLEHTFGPDAAERTLAAGFVLGERHEVACHLDHAVGLVKDDQTARSHHGTGLHESLVIDRRIGHPFGNATAGRPPDLDGFQLVTIGDPATDVVDDLTNGHPHRHFDHPSAANLAR